MFKKIFPLFVLYILLLTPGIIFGAPLVPCATEANPEPCEFKHVIVLVNNLVNFIFLIAVPIAAIIFAWAGAKLIFAGGNEGEMQKAKAIFWDVVLGLVFIAASWLIVHVVLTLLGYQGEWFGFDE